MAHQAWAQAIYRVGQIVGALSAATIALLTVTDVALRYLFNRPIFGAAEITNALLGVLVGAGLIVAAGLRIHIRIDMLEMPLRRQFPTGYPRWNRVSELIGMLAFAALLVRHAWHTISDRELTAVLEFPIGWVFAVVALLTFGAVSVLASGYQPLSAAEGEHS
ncbi:MAG: TRAP transporter small permease [Burkholderiales bacterium]|nr:TRAP transporter small permease [Burkholderiales bacterium]MCJ7838940.1 TRAP transporter small permease [Burkholderiales bacterium]